MAKRINTLFTSEREKDLIKTTLDIVAESLLRGRTALAMSNDAILFAHNLSSAMGPCELPGCEICSGERSELTGRKFDTMEGAKETNA